MPVKLDTNIIIYIAMIAALAAVVVFSKNGKGRAFGIIIRLILGAGFIYVFNLLDKYINVSIPLNPVTAAMVGLLEIPGVVLIIIIRYIIYPVP